MNRETVIQRDVLRTREMTTAEVEHRDTWHTGTLANQKPIGSSPGGGLGTTAEQDAIAGRDEYDNNAHQGRRRT